MNVKKNADPAKQIPGSKDAKSCVHTANQPHAFVFSKKMSPFAHSGAKMAIEFNLI
jgi:hypothetical protein